MKVVLRRVAASVLVLLCVSLSLADVFAQARPSSKTSDIAVGPLGYITNSALTFQYEWKAANLNSWMVRLHLLQAPNANYGIGFGLGGGYRFFLADSRALTGLSVAPAADIIFDHSSALVKSPASFWIGGDIAYKWIFDQISVEPLFGARIGFGGNESIPTRTGLVPVIQVFVGYAW